MRASSSAPAGSKTASSTPKASRTGAGAAGPPTTTTATWWGGLLAGRKFTLTGARFRIEVDGTFGDMSTRSDRVDPIGRDETARAWLRWASTARVGLEHQEGPVTIFINGGAALAGITNSVTDIDSNPSLNIPPHRDPDDSFHDRSTKLGWVLGLGIEAPLRDNWTWRLDGSYLGFGRGTHLVNRSGNNPCGPGGPPAGLSLPGREPPGDSPPGHHPPVRPQALTREPGSDRRNG